MDDGRILKDGQLCYLATRNSACRIGPADNFHEEEPLHTDHSGLVKFSSKSDDSYVRVVERMKTLVKDAPAVVRSRFTSNTSMLYLVLWN